MNTKTLILGALMSVCSMTISAQDAKQTVVDGIAQIERMIDGHQWHEAFDKLRSIEAAASGNAQAMYLATKQRFRMYQRINKYKEAADCMQRMEALAQTSRDTKTIEDMLHTKAAYYAAKGDSKVSRMCYEQMFNRRSAGKDNDGKEACFKQMIDEATKNGNNTMKAVATELYQAWQDSIGAVRASEELKALKVNYENAQQEIDDKDTKIGVQWGTIIVLTILLIGVALLAGFLFLMMVKNIRTSKKLRERLNLSEQNSAQKSVFMRNIGKQIAPSINEISKGNAKVHITALEKMLSDVETFVNLDDTKNERYEAESVNTAEICQAVVDECAANNIKVETDATKMSFPVCANEAKELMVNIIKDFNDSSAERIVVSFKKRNPHTGQFLITFIGKKLDEEEKQALFTAFAKVYDLTKTSGLVVPIAALMAHKMGGTLSLDEQFAKGTRFELKIEC